VKRGKQGEGKRQPVSGIDGVIEEVKEGDRDRQSEKKNERKREGKKGKNKCKIE
jgi:hypothetical protein